MTADHIRVAAPQDTDAVLALATAFATSFAVEPAAFQRAFSTLLTDPHTHLLVAEQDGQVIGYLLGFVHTTFYANGPVAWVEEITVAATARRHGIGRLLMQQFEQWAAARDAKLVALATRRAESFYQALGYAESAIYFRKLLG
jgi:GNAT superfamily N-acetyltransferase